MTRVRCCSCYIQTTTDCYSVNACSRVAPTTRSHDSASVLNLGVSATHRAALLTTVQLGHSAIQQVLHGLLPHNCPPRFKKTRCDGNWRHDRRLKNSRIEIEGQFVKRAGTAWCTALWSLQYTTLSDRIDTTSRYKSEQYNRKCHTSW